MASVNPMSVANPFLSAVSVPTTPVPTPAKSPAKKEEQPPAVQQETGTAKKKKRKRKKKSETTPAAGESVFDLGKSEIAGAVAAPPNSAAAAAAPPSTKKAKKAKVAVSPTPSFRNLQLPVASFSMPPVTNAAVTPKAASPKRSTSPQHDPAPPAPSLPIPTATPAHLKWKNAVIATRENTSYAIAFNFERYQKMEFANGISGPSDWITSRPYGKWCSANPSSIAIDCEMCETKDPISGKSDNKALCRISVVNADNRDEVLLDTLVKPLWPVSNHRTWVNGISESDLENVQFTLKHAQTFMAALCSDQTVVVGHAVHNDLLALRMVHHCNADTAMLFTHIEETDGTPSLKNLAHGVLGREMPDVHDSVNDARVALLCAQHYVAKNGKVDPVEKKYTRSSSRHKLDAADTTMLLVHRLPNTTVAEHLTEMFLAYTHVKPKKVPEIQFNGTYGKCNIEFSTKEHAELAYTSLVGEEREDKTGKKQKRVGLKGDGYVCVRKMNKGK
mmetsp:Transcript_6875/g.12884  ORF Transcript_6875/g.12884 Transcript_6875/m.12884 type:complete len:503 (-) Transcript_6875:231-1739(-)|eukprot:CAMPEP_0201663844 /NCGR_PEP_ID=MMETSP0494-20130426/5507_1 /ASSEMBLY_ACC=CAM_ASM_000839 /TAXON_ID=420259 /ORGANISM="Thalassiosira gravida, Strain GMp14c1" /LENGTH=502 /DNA_ID=CAMNT_0048142515 /DNA_START=57 /DNA_END=1565 /DNA_ORIENTATION=+